METAFFTERSTIRALIFALPVTPLLSLKSQITRVSVVIQSVPPAHKLTDAILVL